MDSDHLAPRKLLLSSPAQQAEQRSQERSDSAAAQSRHSFDQEVGPQQAAESASCELCVGGQSRGWLNLLGKHTPTAEIQQSLDRCAREHVLPKQCVPIVNSVCLPFLPQLDKHLSDTRQEDHQKRLKRLKKELDYIAETDWKYSAKPF